MLFKYNLHFNPQKKHPSSFFATHLALVLARCYQPQNSQMFVRTQNWWWQGRSPHIAYIVLIMRLVSESFIFVLFFAFQQYQPLIMDLTIYHKVYADVRISQQTVQESVHREDLLMITRQTYTVTSVWCSLGLEHGKNVYKHTHTYINSMY